MLEIKPPIVSTLHLCVHARTSPSCSRLGVTIVLTFGDFARQEALLACDQCVARRESPVAGSPPPAAEREQPRRLEILRSEKGLRPRPSLSYLCRIGWMVIGRMYCWMTYSRLDRNDDKEEGHPPDSPLSCTRPLHATGRCCAWGVECRVKSVAARSGCDPTHGHGRASSKVSVRRLTRPSSPS